MSETTHVVLVATPRHPPACPLTGRLDRHWFRRHQSDFYKKISADKDAPMRASPHASMQQSAAEKGDTVTSDTAAAADRRLYVPVPVPMLCSTAP